MKRVLTFALFMGLAATYRGLSLDFQRNEPWGTVNAANYNAVVSKNGSFSFRLKGGGEFNCSFIRCWKMRQRFPLTRLTRAKRLPEKEGEVALRFDYFWDKGTVEETLRFTATGVKAHYRYALGETTRTNYLCCLLEARSWKDDMDVIGLEQNGELERFNKRIKTKGRFISLVIPRFGDYAVTLTTLNDARWRVEKTPVFALFQNWRFGRWINSRDKGEVMEFAYAIHLTKADGATIQNKTISFDTKK